MKVKFRRSGGFAPTHIGCDLDTTQMDASDAAELQRLVDTSGAMQSDSRVNKQVRDAHMFFIEITSEGQHKKLQFDQTSVPEPIKPLIVFLKDRSQNILED